MTNKREMILQRPAVLFAAAFSIGIALWELAWWWMLCFCGIFYGVYLKYLVRSGRFRLRVSVADWLLVFTPVFLLCGYFNMRWANAQYQRRQEALRCVLAEDSKLLACGTVAQLTSEKTGYSFELRKATAYAFGASADTQQEVGTLLVYLSCDTDALPEVKEGQKVRIYGKGSVCEGAANPGQFDAKQFYFPRQITGTLQSVTIFVTDSDSQGLNQALFLVRRQLQRSFSDYLGEDAGVVSSMLLGERALLSEETRTLYRKGGISHLLAISGLHVSLFGAFLYQLLRKSFLGRNGAIPISCFCVLLYGRFVNAGVATKRAIIMFFLLQLAAMLGRTYDSLSAMSVSLCVLLAISPGALFSSGFQLSYAAAYGASVFAALLRENGEKQEEGLLLGEWRQVLFKLKDKVYGGVSFGLSVTLVTLPIILYHFFEFPVYGLLINPIVIPFMTLLLFCSLCCGAIGMGVPVLGVFFSGGARVILELYRSLCAGIDRLPFSVLLFGRPGLLQIAAYYLVLAVAVVLRRKEKRRFRRIQTVYGEKVRQPFGSLLLFLFLPFLLLPIPKSGARFSFLSVGQGDCAVMEIKGRKVYLVDGGSSDITSVGEMRILPYLKSKGIMQIDAWFISHGDQDHVSAVLELLENMEPISGNHTNNSIGRFATYHGNLTIRRLVIAAGQENEALIVRIMALAKEKNVEIITVQAGDRIRTREGLELVVFSPETNRDYADKNSSSMVFLASYREFDVLYTGDATTEAEADFVERLHKELEEHEKTIEVIKIGHHGSVTSSSELLLSAVGATEAVISCGRQNRYGHPHREVVERLTDAGFRIRRTDEEGYVSFLVCNDVTQFLQKHIIEELSNR